MCPGSTLTDYFSQNASKISENIPKHYQTLQSSMNNLPQQNPTNFAPKPIRFSPFPKWQRLWKCHIMHVIFTQFGSFLISIHNHLKMFSLSCNRKPPIALLIILTCTSPRFNKIPNLDLISSSI